MQLTFGNYYSGSSYLHKLDPRIKFVGSLFWMFIIFFLQRPLSLVFYLIFLGLMIYLSKIPFKKIVKSLRQVWFITLIAFLVNIFVAPGEPIWQFGFLKITNEGLLLAVKLSLRIIFLMLTTSILLTLVTTPIEIADAIESVLKPLKKFGFPSHEIAMMISIALRFIPTLVEEADKLMKAQMARGAQFDSGSIFSRLKSFTTVLVPLFISSLKRAEDLSLAMEARCYQGGDKRTKMRQLIFKKSDYRAIFYFTTFAIFLILIEVGAEKWIFYLK